MTKDLDEFAKRLRALRGSRSRNELIDALRKRLPGLHLSDTTIANWEKGDHAPRGDDVVWAMEAEFNVERGYLSEPLGIEPGPHVPAQGPDARTLEAVKERLEPALAQFRALVEFLADLFGEPPPR